MDSKLPKTKEDYIRESNLAKAERYHYHFSEAREMRSCACKKRYTYEEASEIANKGKQHFYKCMFCQGYHFTSQLDYEQRKDKYFSNILKGQVINGLPTRYTESSRKTQLRLI